jgi:hypothetical protein
VKSKPVRCLNNPGYAARFFVDNGANVNTISQEFRQYLLDNGLKDTLIPGPNQDLTVTLAGGYVM